MSKKRELLLLVLIAAFAVGSYLCAMGGLQKIATGGGD